MQCEDVCTNFMPLKLFQGFYVANHHQHLLPRAGAILAELEAIAKHSTC